EASREPGAVVSCGPSSGDRTRPSPRLPPSPFTKHRSGACEKEGALVTWLARPETEADRAAVREGNLAAFPTPAEADLVDALRADPRAWIPGLSWVAETPGGHIAGFALLTRCHVDGSPALALAPCAVRPEYQRQGAGSAAIRAALDAVRHHPLSGRLRRLSFPDSSAK